MKRRKRHPIREDKQHRLEVHVAGCCFRQCDGKLQLLVGKRTGRRRLYPNYWECGGGQVRVGENFGEALKRQFYEEFAVDINMLGIIGTYEIIRSDGPKIPGLRFICISADNGREDVDCDSREFSEHKWVTKSQCRYLRMIPGLREDILRAFTTIEQAEAEVFPRRPKGKRKLGF